jgi:hypothetical protein
VWSYVLVLIVNNDIHIKLSNEILARLFGDTSAKLSRILPEEARRVKKRTVMETSCKDGFV